ncbi:MAG: DNA repair protein RecO [Propionibacteriaceae bacterium]|jgi:DNA repair protein RecO (recombination protein O)|nr:DNA repair protein RecO [Propionibacteriaceae bacterium]
MPTYRDQGVVLRTYRLGEADRIIIMLAREHGKIRAVAKGVRRTSSKFGARLEPFSHIDAQFAVGRNLDIITQVETLHLFGAPLSSDYPRYTAGEVMLETADKLVVEGEPAGQQYRLLVGALQALSVGTNAGPRPSTMILDSYLLRALSVAGYAPNLQQCARCGAPGQWFSAAAGGMVCADCRPSGAAKVPAAAWQLLGMLLSGDWAATQGCPDTVLREVDGLVAGYVSWHLEHSLRSLPLLERDGVREG